ncbi:MAG: isopeptide-forming domain-containing fimbrial protein, partial [Proteobacteria bacterium]|nr:isopeptide-forming domain-containing fimbrial protein [Pseudomonadota bacterium]
MKVRSRLGSSLLLFFVLWLGAVSSALAAKCSEAPYFGVVDGTAGYPIDSAITIDTDCTFQNFTAANPLTATINFQTNDPSIYLIVFDNVIFTGNMACSNVEHKIWFVNGSDYGSGNNCQDLFVPAETIDKQNPAGTTAVGIGEPFTYTLTLPSMQAPVGAPSPNELRKVIIGDDLTATGADLTFVSINAYYLGSGIPVTLEPEDGTSPVLMCGTWTNKNLCYKPIPVIFPGEQIVIEITVVADDTPANVAGTSFVNTAKWWFEREIDIDGDGSITPDEIFFPLPGESGVSPPLIIGEPDFVVTKSSTESAINLSSPVPFTIDAQNVGGATAWGVTIEDQLPVGMCDNNPLLAPFSVQITAADGTPLIGLVQGVHYTATYSVCNLTIALASAIPISPTQRLLVSYEGQLDATVTTNGLALTNVAGATQWFSADGTYPTRTFNRTLTDGTPAISDYEDSFTIITALSGYYFQKTVENVTTGANPTTTAAPGDRLRYRLRLYNVDQLVENVLISDVLDPTLFDTSTFFAVTPIAPGADHTFDTVTGQLDVFGAFGFPLNLPIGNEIVMEFEINLIAPLVNGTVVPNQASLTFDNPDYPATDPNPTITTLSDDPYVNGIAAPGDPADSTDVVIQAPGPLLKANSQASATIGEQFTYTITVPETPVDIPLYDVRILDDLTASNADMRFISATVLAGGAWAISNTGTDTSIVLEDVATGIDIPANGQAVIEITVELQNTLTNQTGLLFNNTASYTYNRSNGVIGTQKAGEAGSTSDMTVLEPHIATITKIANNITPTAGDVVRYSVTLTATGGAGYSDVFDVALTDNLDLGLVYVGNPTVTIGAGVGADNAIGDPDITGDGVATAQTLVWSLNSTVPADMDIAAGTSITISYDVRVDNSVLANQTLTNSVVAQWTSIDGASGGERDGSDGIGGLNDYITSPVIETVTTPNIVATIAKNRTSDT